MTVTKNLSKLFFASAVFLIISTLISCNRKNQFDVNFYFPDAKTNGVLPGLVTAYGVKNYRIPVDSDSLLALYDNLQKKYLGGVGISGTITIDEENITFEPAFGSSLMGDGFKVFRVPLKDIYNVKSESFLVITKAVVVSTKNGEFKFQVAKAKHWYNPFKFEDGDIVKLIKEKMNK